MVKIPEKLYITAKKQPITEYDPMSGTHIVLSYGPNFAFLQGYNPKNPHDKKHLTQREWAYCNFNGCKLEDRSGVLCVTGELVEWKNQGIVRTPVDKPVDPQPLIINNAPVQGFKIQRFVSRYSTSNKLWRVLDPRGFETEITTSALDDIIQNSDIDKGGFIRSDCVWVSNKNLKVV